MPYIKAYLQKPQLASKRVWAVVWKENMRLSICFFSRKPKIDKNFINFDFGIGSMLLTNFNRWYGTNIKKTRTPKLFQIRITGPFDKKGNLQNINCGW